MENRRTKPSGRHPKASGSLRVAVVVRRRSRTVPFFEFLDLRGSQIALHCLMANLRMFEALSRERDGTHLLPGPQDLGL